MHRDRLVEIKVALHLLAGEVPGEQEHREDEIGLLGHLMPIDDDRVVLVEQGELGEGGIFDIPPLFREEAVVLRIDTARFVVGDIGIVDRALPFGGLFVREVDLLRQSSVLVGHLFLQERDGFDGVFHIFARHHIGIAVVVDEDGELVGTRHAVIAELAAFVVDILA